MFRFVLKVRNKRRVQRLKSQHIARKEKKELLKNPHFQKKRSQKESNRIVYWLKKDGWAIVGILCMITIATWYFGLYTSTFKIQSVEVSGTQFITTEDLHQFILNYEESKILGLQPRNTYWTLNSEKLEKKIIEHYSDVYAIESVDVQKKFPSSLSIVIVERIPQVIWISVDGDTERYYTIDREGYVTQSAQTLDDLNPRFPQVRDLNRTQLGVDWQIISAEYVDFVLKLHEGLFSKKVGVEIESYTFPITTCQEKQYVAEKIFQQEILDSASEEYRQKKREIQQLFQDGELTIDQSLDELERIKNEELKNLDELVEGDTGFEKTEWATIYVQTACDYVRVGHELHVHTTGEHGGFTVYMDTTTDIELQLNNVQTILNEHVTDRSAIQYIDVRIPGRAYVN